MAKLLNKIPTNITEYPNSFKRQGAFPLEAYSVFVSYAAAQEYASTSLIAYVGQPLAVIERKEDGAIVASYYFIGDEAGALIQLGTSSDIVYLDDRIKEIEKFFATEDGESIKDTLDELVELQKWIEEHLGEFDKFQKEINKTVEEEQLRAEKAEEALSKALESTKQDIYKSLETAEKVRKEGEEKLSQAIDAEHTRATDSEAALTKTIEEETTRASKAEEKIVENLESETTRLTTAIEEENTRARIAEANISEKIDIEATRALKVEEIIRAELHREIDRATAEELRLDGKLNEEIINLGDELHQAIKDENGRAVEAEDNIYQALAAETERANAEDLKLIGLIEAEASRANAADEELYQAIENLTEEDIHLKSDLYTYVNIGKITGASDTSRKKIANKGASLKTVFNAIFGTRQDKKPTITNNASLTATEGTKAYGGGEYGSTVTETTVTINFTLANTGTTNYGYKVGETSYKGNQTFYYPIVKQENADLVITLPTGQTAEVITENSLVKTVDNVIYCNFVNKSVSIKISLPADTVETSEQTRYGTISAAVSLGVPQDANGNTITAFLTYLESEGEPAQETAPAPSNQQGGSKTDTAGPYKINKGYIPYTYCLSSDLPSTLPTANRTEKQPTSITVSGGNDSTYLYIFVPTGNSDIKSMSASGFAVPFNKAAASKTYAVNNGKETTYKVFKTEGSVKADTFIIG